jgi:hypothetical protein
LPFVLSVYSPVPSIVGVIIALLLLVPLAVGAVWYFRCRNKRPMEMLISSTNQAVEQNQSQSYENPYFNQEITMSHLQVGVDV